MHPLHLDQIAKIVEGERLSRHYNGPIQAVETDTRLPFRENALFVALTGAHYHAAEFVADAARKGARAAVVDREIAREVPGIDLIRVKHSLRALQALARYHRRTLELPILAVTGSNGKTIFKDFLTATLSREMTVNASPGSYNSQVGVALSLLGLRPEARLGIIEAGISRTGEMEPLAHMIEPRFGVLTNIGMAHYEGFGSRENIAREKLKLFQHLPADGWLLAPRGGLPGRQDLSNIACPVYFIGGEDERLPGIIAVKSVKPGVSALKLRFPNEGVLETSIPMDFSWQEVFTTLEAGICAAHLLGVRPPEIVESLARFQPPLNRIEVWKSQQGAILANDSYSSDPVSARACLNVFDQYPNKRKVFIFGGMKELGRREEYQHRVVAEEAARKGVDLLITIGKLPARTQKTFKARRPGAETLRFDRIEEAADYLDRHAGHEDLIVLKGPRESGFDLIPARFKAKHAQTVYYVNLAKIRSNLFTFKELVPRGCKLMVMLKAFAYGTDALHIAQALQHDVDFFGVAYTKEAVALRRSGIGTDLLVQLVMPEDYEDVVRYGLRPVIFDRETAAGLASAAQAAQKKLKVHLKVDTGMGRFGAFPHELEALAQDVSRLPNLEIEGLMTHFSSADDPDSDAFTRKQIERFGQCTAQLAALGIHPPLCHAAATSAAARFPEAHFSMVRLGLGLFGSYPSPAVNRAVKLACPVALVSKIGVVRKVPKGWPLNYNRRFVTERDSLIAILPIGYHDGLSRRLSNGGMVSVRGKRVPIVGSVCMDFTTIDVTDVPDVSPGDPVLIFGEWRGQAIRMEDLAAIEETIPYDVLCRLSERIQRVYLMNEL